MMIITKMSLSLSRFGLFDDFKAQYFYWAFSQANQFYISLHGGEMRL